MDYQQIKEHFGSAAKAARELGLSARQTVHTWKRKGVPEQRQYQIEVLTGGALKADRRESA